MLLVDSQRSEQPKNVKFEPTFQRPNIQLICALVGNKSLKSGEVRMVSQKTVVLLDFVKITFFAIWFCFKLFPTAIGSFEQDCKRIIPQYFTMLSCCLLRLVLDETKYIYVE